MQRYVGSRSWPLLAVFVVITLVISACGGGTAPSPQVVEKVVTQIVEKPVEVEKVVEKTVEVQVTVAPSADAGTMRTGAADEPVLIPDVSGDIEFWHFWASPVRRNAIRRVIALCQQRLPNIKVTDTVKPFGDIWTANLAAVAAGSGMPDVIVSDRPQLPRDAADGVYMSLQEWADRDNVTRAQFYDWAWDQAVSEGATYGIPHETDVNVLFYNKNLFEQAGLDPNKPPTTWAELEEYANKLDVIENGEIRRVGFFPLWNRGTDLWQYVNSADMVAPDGTIQINNPKMVETVEWMKKWVDRYGGWEKLQSFRNQYGAPPNDIFMQGGVAMYVDIFGYNSALQFYRPTVTLDNGEKPRMDWGISLLPYNTEPGTSSGGFSMSIPTGAKNPEAAWEFIKCATGAEGQASWARDTQAQPTNLKAATDPVLLADPLWQVVDDALETSTGGVYVAKYPNWAEQLTQRWEQVWLGNLSPQQMLDEAQAAVEAAVK
ncbi:MAG: ABC transporter substrate-binding protein [Anaerolineae bacterium]|nr:ABC transporter substrate-binding protein [Anaerolineae bacterium]